MTLRRLRNLPCGTLVRVRYSLDGEGVPVRDGRLCEHLGLVPRRVLATGRKRWAAYLRSQAGARVVALPEDMEVVDA